MSLLLKKLNEYNTREKIQALCEEINSKLPKSDDCKIHIQQMNCAINGLKMFDSNLPRPNHLVIQGKTQCGKTGALTAMIMLIARFKLESIMDIREIYYITGDNSCKLIKQTENRIIECFKSDEINCKFHCMKNSDLKSNIINVSTLTNAMIFVDESHYGTSKENNIVIQWLKSKGLDMHNSGELVDKKVYIISNSATPYGEINSDPNVWKSYVKLETDDWNEVDKEGYVGFKEYHFNNCFIPCKAPLKKSNMDYMCSEFFEKLNNIKETTGKDKCAIVRMCKDTYNKSKDIIEKYFHVEAFFASGKNIPYSEIEKCMEHSCDINIYSKPLMIIIAGAYRMGVSIPPYCKKNIGVIFDYSSGNGKTGTLTTEQGLMGRVTGYWKKCDDWRDMNIYINEKHYNSLIGCYIEHATSTPMSNVNKKGKFIEDNNGNEISIIEEPDIITIPCNGRFVRKERFYNQRIEDFLKGPYGFNLIGKSISDDIIYIQGRRNSSTLKTHFNKPKFGEKNHEAYIKKLEKNINKQCYTTLYDEENDIIMVKYGKIVKGKYEKQYDENRSIIPTMSTDF